MAFIFGCVIASIVSVLATRSGFDKDRAFYPTVMVVIASYYVLFAAMVGAAGIIFVELTGMLLFAVLAVLGFKRNLWLVAAALFAHGVFDLFHGQVVANPGVPLWWPMFCLAYDVTAAAYLCWLLRQARLTATEN